MTTSDPPRRRVHIVAPGETPAAWDWPEPWGDAFGRAHSPLYAPAQDLCDHLYAITRSGIDPARIGIRPWPDGLSPALDPRRGFVGAACALSAFLYWAELHGRDLRMLPTLRHAPPRQVYSSLRAIRDVLSDPAINQRDGAWKDLVLDADTQSRIGARMAGRGGAPIGPEEFSARLRREIAAPARTRAFAPAAAFFAELEPWRDFRMVRIRMLVILLIDLLEILLPGGVDATSLETALRWFHALDATTGGRGWRSAHTERAGRRLAASARWSAG